MFRGYVITLTILLADYNYVEETRLSLGPLITELI